MSIPYSIVRATKFFEFVRPIADLSTDGNTVHVPPVLVQPIPVDDVASAVCRIAEVVTDARARYYGIR